MSGSAKVIYVFFAIVFLAALILLGYNFYISNFTNSSSFYTFTSEVTGLEIVADGTPLMTFMQKPYQMSGGLKNVNVSLVNEKQNKITFVDKGNIYASAGIEKSREDRTVDVYIQIDTSYFETQSNLDNMVSYLILKSVYSFQTSDADQLDAELNGAISDYVRIYNKYPFMVNEYDK